ncbi:MAG: hypothetical protein AB1705_27755 [Verrucomicrobiota bacterium]
MNRLVCGLTALMLATISPAFAQDKPDAAKLSEALKEIDALKQRLMELERTVQSLSKEPPKAAPAAQSPSATTVDKTKPLTEESAKELGFVRWNELTAGKSRLKFYGFLRLDAIYDDSRPNNTQIPSFIRSEDPTAPAAIATRANSDSLTIHPRLTRLGADFAGPDIDALGGAKVSGKAEIDFYNLPSSESRNAPRMRHAYLKLSWDEMSFLAGQTSDVISPIFPIVNPDFVMWGAGNLGDRRPQFRFEYTPKIGKGSLIFQSEAGLTSADDAQDLDPAAAGAFRDGEASGKPTLQARLAYAFALWEKQRLEFGVWGHRAWERTDTAIGASGRNEFDSYAYGFDLTVPIYRDLVWFKGELWGGRNLSDVRGGILQGINAATGAEVDAVGGWAEFGVRPKKWFSFHGGYSFDNPDNNDLLGAATPGRASNSIWYSAARLYFDPIEIGMDYLFWTTEHVGFGPGRDNRFQWFISYKF